MAKIIIEFSETARGDVEFTATSQDMKNATAKEKVYVKAVSSLLRAGVPEIGKLLGASATIFHGKPSDS